MLSSFLLFFSFSGSEIMLIFFVALILFGGDKLPEIARGLGKGIREFKDMSDGVKREIHSQINNYDAEKPREESNNVPIIPPVTVAPAEVDYNMPPAYTSEALKPEIDPAHELPAHDASAIIPHDAAPAMPEHQVASLEPVVNAPKPTTIEEPAKPKLDLSQPPNTISHQSY